ncbi:MAG: hypothetical protein M3Z66_00035 [Chloroflexota bacterium]|nr:hypothetical protein [Chloroflexota bacterium]
MRILERPSQLRTFTFGGLSLPQEIPRGVEELHDLIPTQTAGERAAATRLEREQEEDGASPGDLRNLVFVRALLHNGPLRPGLSAEEATDTVWTVTSSEVHRLLTVDCGWNTQRYETWLAETLGFLLLPLSGYPYDMTVRKP